ncbi:MAG: SoxR reducing system RseC family protein [Halothiobacillaceae bacterium]|nr:SoxR reducing system RseC family protein [Halothiobacillaceae bacterium]
MMTERARVVALDGESAIVEVSIKSACGSCGHGTSCGITTLGKLVRPRPARWRMENRAGAGVGDEVLLALDDAALSTAAVFAYLPPLFGLLLGAALAEVQGAGDGGVVLGSLAGLGLGLLAARFLSNRAGLRPHMLSVDESRAYAQPSLQSQPIVFMENKL